MKGLFITFEGSEGSGKSTHSRLLGEFLTARGFAPLMLREPGGTRISEKIRQLLLDPENTAMSASAEMLLYMASRAQTVEEVIKPALQKGKIVICDRFLDSTIAYQGYGLGTDTGIIKNIGSFATGGLKPGVTLLLDLPVKNGLRHRKHGDRIERRSLSYHMKVRKGYMELASREPGRIKVIKVRKEISRTQEEIRKVISRFLEKRRTG